MSLGCRLAGRLESSAQFLFLFGGFVEVVGEVAGEHAGIFVGAEFHRLLDDGVEEVPVVGNDEEGAGVVDEGLLQNVLRLHVEVVGGLVENKEVGGADEHADEGDAGAFTTGEDADFFEDVVAFKKEAAEDVAGGHFGAAGLDFFDGFEDGEVGIEFVGVVLVEEGGEGFGSEVVVAGGGLFVSRDHAAEGGFSGTVGSDDGDFFAPSDFEIEVAEDGEGFSVFEGIVLGGFFELGDEVGRGRGIREAEGHHGID